MITPFSNGLVFENELYEARTPALPPRGTTPIFFGVAAHEEGDEGITRLLLCGSDGRAEEAPLQLESTPHSTPTRTENFCILSKAVGSGFK
jgi:hypothetical protein